jgi:uncharacterized protein
MKRENESVLKIYSSTTDKIGQKILYEHIVHLAKDDGISGVTVYRGIMGYGLSSHHISSSKFWELTEKLPVVIELIDTEEKLIAFYAEIESGLESMPKGCLVSLENVQVLLRKKGAENTEL